VPDPARIGTAWLMIAKTLPLIRCVIYMEGKTYAGTEPAATSGSLGFGDGGGRSMEICLERREGVGGVGRHEAGTPHDRGECQHHDSDEGDVYLFRTKVGETVVLDRGVFRTKAT
jgi:hypothetical protein